MSVRTGMWGVARHYAPHTGSDWHSSTYGLTWWHSAETDGAGSDASYREGDVGEMRAVVIFSTGKVSRAAVGQAGAEMQATMIRRINFDQNKLSDFFLILFE